VNVLLAASLLLLSACEEGAEPGRIETVTQQGEIVAVADTPDGRVRAALAGVSAEKPHATLLKDFEKYSKGKILVDAPEKVTGLPEGRAVGGMLDNAAFAKLLWENDDAAAADALAAADIRFILLRRDILPSVDRGGHVLGRLYHDDFRQRFELRAIDKEFLLYKVLDTPRTFPVSLARVATSQLRARMKGEDVEKVPAIKAKDGMRWNLVASVRKSGGREIAFGSCLNDELQACVDQLAGSVEVHHRRFAEWYGFAPLAEEVDELIIDLHRLTERTDVLTRDDEDLKAIWEMGIDGAILYDVAGSSPSKRIAYFPGSVAYTRSYREPDRMLRHAAKEHYQSVNRPWKDSTNSLEKFRAIHYQDDPERGVQELFRGVPPVPMDLVDIQALEESLELASEWYMQNMAPTVELPHNLRYDDGQVTYKYWPAENRYSNEYNLVRHTLATWNLVQGYNITGREEFLEGAESALDWTLRYRVDEGDMSFIRYNNNVKLGSVVVGLMGIIDLARATGTTEYDDLMVRFGNFTLFMQEDSGKFDPYYVPDDHPYANETNDIVPGEALLALMMLHEYTGDDKWLAPAEKYFDYYIPWWNKRVVKRQDTGTWPMSIYDNQTRLDLVQFGPWTVMAANAYHKATGDERAASFALEVGRWMIDSYGWMPDNSPWPDYIGGYYKMPGELPAMQAFCYAEGTAAAYKLALRYRAEEVAYFEEATRAAARFALVMQFDDNQTYAFSRPEMVRGGTRYAMNETKVRIDYVYHAFSAVYQYLEAAKTDPNLPATVKESPLRSMMINIAGPGETRPE